MASLGGAADRLAEELRSAIIRNELLPGDVLVQAELASRYGVSRIPLREALRTLASEGLVTSIPGMGTIVTQLTPDSVVELYELRRAIEPPLAPEIIDHADPNSIAHLRRLSARSDARTNAALSTSYTINYDFHMGMYRLTGSRYRLRIIEQLMNLTEAFARVHLPQGHRADLSEIEHLQMVDAIEERDVDLLEQRICEHLSHSSDALAQVVSLTDPG